MLSGIKSGRKKKRTATNGDHASFSIDSAATNKKQRSGNLSAAQLLKKRLKSGNVPRASSSLQHQSGLEARLARATTEEQNDANVVVLTGAAAATTSDRPDYRPGTYFL
jgi:hypothetical protein